MTPGQLSLLAGLSLRERVATGRSGALARATTVYCNDYHLRVVAAGPVILQSILTDCWSPLLWPKLQCVERSRGARSRRRLSLRTVAASCSVIDGFLFRSVARCGTRRRTTHATRRECAQNAVAIAHPICPLGQNSSLKTARVASRACLASSLVTSSRGSA